MGNPQEFISTLPFEMAAIPLTFVAGQLAAAFHDPSDDESEEAVRHGLLTIQFESEIAEAVQRGKLPIRHPETWGLLSFPIPSALVRVDELNEYLRASGRPIKVVPPAKPLSAPDWDLWNAMRLWELWQAIALTTNIDPLKVKFQEQAWMGGASDYPHIDFQKSGFTEEDEQLYKKRYMLLRDSYRRPPFNCRTALTAEHMNQVEAEAFIEWANEQPLFSAMPFEMRRPPKRDERPDIDPFAPEPAVPVSQVADELRPVQRSAAQEAKILAALRSAGYDPEALPALDRGKSGAKAQAKKALKDDPLFAGQTVFGKAWGRLRSSGDISGGT